MTAPRLLTALLFLAACAPSDGAPSDAERRAAADEVRAASAGLLDALNAHDADAVLDFYQSSAGFTYVGCTHVIAGRDLFGGVLRGYHRSRPEVRYDMAITTVEVLDGDAAVVALQGESDSLKLFTTRVWRRGDDGRWRVAYEHESWPGCAAPAPPHPGTASGDRAVSAAPSPTGR